MSYTPYLAFALMSMALSLPPLGAAEPQVARGGGLAVEDKGELIEFRQGTEVITRYYKGPDVAKPYFWPLNAPGGVPTTRAWPMDKSNKLERTDHVHQKSAWFCHGDVIPEGLNFKSNYKDILGVNFWDERPGHGRIVCTSRGDITVVAGTPSGSVATRNEWRTPDGVKILDESRAIQLHLLDGGARLIVLDIDLHASVYPITFGDTKEGSMGVRVREEFALNMKGSNGTVTSSDGTKSDAPAKDNLPVWGRAADWHDYSGTVEGKKVGIAIFDDPKNPQRAYWHTRAYGLMAANPFGRAKSGFPAQKGNTELVKVAKGEHLKLRYGILLHSGDAKEGKVAEHYERFVKLR